MCVSWRCRIGAGVHFCGSFNNKNPELGNSFSPDAKKFRLIVAKIAVIPLLWQIYVYVARGGEWDVAYLALTNCSVNCIQRTRKVPKKL